MDAAPAAVRPRRLPSLRLTLSDLEVSCSKGVELHYRSRVANRGGCGHTGRGEEEGGRGAEQTEEGEATRGNRVRLAAEAGTGKVGDWGALSPGHPHTPGRDTGCDVAAHTQGVCIPHSGRIGGHKQALRGDGAV